MFVCVGYLCVHACTVFPLSFRLLFPWAGLSSGSCGSDVGGLCMSVHVVCMSVHVVCMSVHVFTTCMHSKQVCYFVFFSFRFLFPPAGLSDGSSPLPAHEELSVLKMKYAEQLKERTALRTILESKMKTIIDDIAAVR
jgi:hypothetical protein